MLTQLFFRGRVLLVFALVAVVGATALWGQAANAKISRAVTHPPDAATAGATLEGRADRHLVPAHKRVDEIRMPVFAHAALL
jgi:hypothetical protein